jgi:hypothetical protein
MPTIKEAFREIRSTGAHVGRSEGEWRVNIPGGNEATAYYTDDTEDAILTAHEMMKRYKLAVA